MVRQVKDPEVGRTTGASASSNSPPRPPLHEKKDSQTNTLRLVPSTPPQFLDTRDPIYGRTALPTSIYHLLSPGKAPAQDVQGPALESEVSKPLVPSTPNGSSTSLETRHPPQRPDSASGSSAASPTPKKNLQVNLNPDSKTFNLSLASTSRTTDDDGTTSTKSPTPANSLSTKSSYEVLSSDTEPISADPINSSPWNYRLHGGLRKVPKTPDLKQKAVDISDAPLPPLPETSDDSPAAAHDLSSKPSFATTESDNTNYKVYQHSPSPSQVGPAPRSSSDSNIEILGQSSPAPSVIHRPQTSDTNENYVLHGDPSPSTSYVTLTRPDGYSQESLVVPPLKPRAGRTNEGFGYYKSRSRESLRTGSLTSISTVLSQKEALRAIVSSGSLVNLPGRSASSGSNSWASSSGTQQKQHMNEHPHQWSSQLSTIGSVSEEGTDRNSRAWSDGNGRRSSGFPSSNSRHSRQMMSISSSLAQDEEQRSGSRSDSLEPPQPAFARYGARSMSNPSIRLVEDLDEYGDGITDMRELRPRSSRNRLSGFFSVSSNDGRTNTMRSTRSTASSRANSLLSNSLPTWARIYYGSGERKALVVPGGSISSGDPDSRTNSFRSGSPSDHFPLSIYSPRRRPREGSAQAGQNPRPTSLDITHVNPVYNQRQPFRTSSVWSPHLRTDLRTRHSAWDVPSINFSTESGLFGKRNSQVVLFITGFIFPFAWMIASFLSLPPDPMLAMRDRDRSSANLDVSNDYALTFGPVDEQRYESARWWRRVNRYMSFVGILIIIAIIVLAVVGVRENW